MSLQVQDLSSVQKKLSFVLPSDRVGKALDEAYKNLGQQVRMNGFRPGKVPRRLLEQRFGRHIEGEVGGQLISEAFDEAIKEKKLQPVSQPIVEKQPLKAGEDWSFSVTVEIKPEIAVTGWEGLDLEWERVEVSDEQLEKELEGMRDQHGTVEAAPEGTAAQAGDYVLVDVKLTAEGKEPWTAESLMIWADRAQGFPQADWLAGKVAGKKTGELLSEDVTVPARAISQDWDDQKAALELKIGEIKTRKLPKLDDDFAVDLGMENLDALRADIRFKLEEHLRQHARGNAGHAAIDKLIEKNPFEVPQGLVRGEAESLLAQSLRGFARGGGKVPRFRLEHLPEEQQKRLLGQGRWSVQRALILDAVARTLDLQVTDEDLEAKIAELASEMGQQPAAVKGLLQKNQGMEELKGRMIEEKAMETILERANVIDVEPGFYKDHDHSHGAGEAALGAAEGAGETGQEHQHDPDHDHSHDDHAHDHSHGDHEHDHEPGHGG